MGREWLFSRITHFPLFSTVISGQRNVLSRILQDTYIVQMFHNISWKSILCFDEHFNDLDKVVRTDIEDFNHPWKSPDKIKQCHFGKLTFKLTSCLTKWKVGLVYPMASTLASRPLDKICPHGWLTPATQPWAPIPGTHHTDDSVGGERRGSGGVVGERQNNCYKLLHTNTAAMKAPKENSMILAVTIQRRFHGSLHLWVWPLTGQDC